MAAFMTYSFADEQLASGCKRSLQATRYLLSASWIDGPKADSPLSAQKLILALANVTVSDGQFKNLSEVQLQRDFLKVHMGRKTDLIPT